jgi:hypothetical protein
MFGAVCARVLFNDEGSGCERERERKDREKDDVGRRVRRYNVEGE